MEHAALVLATLLGATPTGAPHATATPRETWGTLRVPAPAQLRFEVVVPPSLRAEPITGRVLVFVARDSAPEPRLQSGGMVSVPFWAADIDQLAPGMPAIVDQHAVGYPLRHLDQLAAGDYYVQAVISVYTRLPRGDGHTMWAHTDEWKGQQFNTAPGTLVTEVRRLHVDPTSPAPIRLDVTRILPPVDVPPDDQRIRHLRIQSTTLTK